MAVHSEGRGLLVLGFWLQCCTSSAHQRIVGQSRPVFSPYFLFLFSLLGSCLFWLPSMFFGKYAYEALVTRFFVDCFLPFGLSFLSLMRQVKNMTLAYGPSWFGIAFGVSQVSFGGFPFVHYRAHVLVKESFEERASVHCQAQEWAWLLSFFLVVIRKVLLVPLLLGLSSGKTRRFCGLRQGFETVEAYNRFDLAFCW